MQEPFVLFHGEKPYVKFVVGRSSVEAPVVPPITAQQLGANLVALLKATSHRDFLEDLEDATGEILLERHDNEESTWQLIVRIDIGRFRNMPSAYKQGLENVLREEASRLLEEFPSHRLEKVRVVPRLVSAAESEVEAYDPIKGFATPEHFYAARELEVLGAPEHGGFGRIVRARRLHLKSEVAIKFFDPHPLVVDTAERRDKARARLIREGSFLASIRHPNVVRLQDQTLVAGDPVLVLEFIQGHTLDALRQERGPLPLTEALGYVSQVLDALAACHDRDIIHRDVAPRNVVIEEGGRAVLIDFGLGVSEEFMAGTRLTSQAMGTPGFRAPELESEPLRVHPSVDIFSVGALLTFLLTGRPPRLGVPPDLPDASPAFMNLVGRTLEVNPDKRPTSARELCDALKAFIPPAPAVRVSITDTKLGEQDVMDALGLKTRPARESPLGEFIHRLPTFIAALANHPNHDAALATLLTAARAHVAEWVPGKSPESLRETKKLELVMRRVMGVLLGTLQLAPSAMVTQAFNQAIVDGWLVQKNYDAWKPGMESGTGWRTIYAISRLGLRWLQQNAQYRSPQALRIESTGASIT